MNWYLNVLKDNYANFSGRSKRSEYWYYVLFNLLICITLLTVVFTVGLFGIVLYFLYAVITLIPNLAVTVRRLHDIGKSGVYILLAFVPLFNIWLLVMLATEGTRGANQYGEDPRDFTNIKRLTPETM
jgi:uncharacterized membrane protein YhaH (DUF805 family)